MQVNERSKLTQKRGSGEKKSSAPSVANVASAEALASRARRSSKVQCFLKEGNTAALNVLQSLRNECGEGSNMNFFVRRTPQKKGHHSPRT